MREEAVVVLRLDASGMPAGAQQAEAAFGRLSAAGQVSARQTAAAMRQLPAQFTDIATQLQGGASPLTVLMQQGGQIKDSFGGVGNAIRGIGAAITPTALAVGSAATVVGLLGFAAYEGAKQQKELRDTIALTGNAAGLTADRLRTVADVTSAASSQTVGGAREIAMALASSGMVSSSALQVLTTAVARVADVSGKSATEIAADFAKMRNGVADWAAEHNKAWNFLTAEQWKYIKRLEDQGKGEEAARVVGQRLIEHLEGQRKELGYLESAWDKVAKAASGAWRAMQDWGKDGAAADQIAAARTLRDGIAARLDKNLAGGMGEAAGAPGKSQNDVLRDQLAQADARLEALMLKRQAAERMADQASARAVAEQKKIDDVRKAAEAKHDSGRPYIPTDDSNYDVRDYRLAAIRADAEENRILAILEHADPAAARRDREAARKRLDTATEFLQEMVDANARATVQLIDDEEERGRQLVELDRQIALRRLAAMVDLPPGAREEAAALINERAGLQMAELSRKTGQTMYDDVKGALAAAFRDSHNPVRAFAQTLGNAIFSRMIDSMAEALATMAVGKDGASGSLGGYLGLIGGAIAGVSGGGISVDTDGVGTNNTGGSLPTRGGMATGTNYVPRNMVALLHRGEAVVPARYNPAAGGGRPVVVQHITYQVPPGQSPAAYAAALASNNRALKAEIAADMARPGRAMNNAARAGA